MVTVCPAFGHLVYMTVCPTFGRQTRTFPSMLEDFAAMRTEGKKGKKGTKGKKGLADELSAEEEEELSVITAEFEAVVGKPRKAGAGRRMPSGCAARSWSTRARVGMR